MVHYERFVMYFAILLALIAFIIQARLRVDKRNVLVIILGDLGRSPRMQAHIASLLKRGFRVDVLTYADSTALSSQIKGRIQIHPVSHVKGSFILRVLVQIIQMAYITLIKLPTVRTILIQVTFLDSSKND